MRSVRKAARTNQNRTPFLDIETDSHFRQRRSRLSIWAFGGGLFIFLIIIIIRTTNAPNNLAIWRRVRGEGDVMSKAPLDGWRLAAPPNSTQCPQMKVRKGQAGRGEENGHNPNGVFVFLRFRTTLILPRGIKAVKLSATRHKQLGRCEPAAAGRSSHLSRGGCSPTRNFLRKQNEATLK